MDGSAFLLACSGDGAMDTIAMNIAVSFVHAKLAAIMLGASLPAPPTPVDCPTIPDCLGCGASRMDD